jgi:hypothetical protein
LGRGRELDKEHGEIQTFHDIAPADEAPSTVCLSATATVIIEVGGGLGVLA